MTIRARVVYTDPVDSSEQIDIGDHKLQCGGQGDGYCYGHQSFDCFETLTPAEREAVREAT